MSDEPKTLERPCPFCGGEFRMSFEAHDNGPVGGMAYIYHAARPLDAKWCPLDITGHFDTGAEAEEFWNGAWLVERPKAEGKRK